jgi:hypothetical protein
MIPYILAAVGGYLIGDSLKEKFADGGELKYYQELEKSLPEYSDGGIMNNNPKQTMNKEYVIINKTELLKKMKELEKTGLVREHHSERYIVYKEILSQSIPLIPEIEKAFDAGRIPKNKKVQGYGGRKTIEVFLEKQPYISNLKLDI